MNSTQAKNLPLPKILSRLGYEPVKVTKGGNELWYISPFRAEKEPSLHISRGKRWNWVWKDFGDIGGTVIDFVMRHENYSRVKDALEFLDNMFQNHLFEKTESRVGRQNKTADPNPFSFHQQSPPQASKNFLEGELEFLEAHSVSNPVIYSYLNGRGIPSELIDRYLVEVKYRHRKVDKIYFAFGMKNESDGFEIRGASDQYVFKSALIKRDVSVIPGRAGDLTKVNVVEGMTDFLSLCAMYSTTQLSGDTIIMHSLSSFHRSVEVIQSKGYAIINLFLDNNRAGREHSEKFKAVFGDQVKDQSDLYAPYEDLNDALRGNQSDVAKMK